MRLPRNRRRSISLTSPTLLTQYTILSTVKRPYILLILRHNTYMPHRKFHRISLLPCSNPLHIYRIFHLVRRLRSIPILEKSMI
jgi:hypothetical protein